MTNLKTMLPKGELIKIIIEDFLDVSDSIYIYENATIVKGEIPSWRINTYQNYHPLTQPVDPETSIRRQSSMSMCRQDVAIRNRIS